MLRSNLYFWKWLNSNVNAEQVSDIFSIILPLSKPFQANADVNLASNKRPMGLDALLKNQLGPSNSCTYTLFLARGGKFRLFLLHRQRFPRYGPIFKIVMFGHETWQVAKVPEVAHMLSFYPRGAKLSLFLLYGQRFLRYGPIFKIAIFGHETWQVAKVPEVAHMLSFYPKGSKLSLFLLYGQRFPRYGPIF